MDTKGTVYVLSNKSLIGIIKIGHTTRNVNERIKELSSSTSIPSGFELKFSWNVDNSYAVEQEIHAICADYRWEKNREFFHEGCLPIVRKHITEVIARQKLNAYINEGFETNTIPGIPKDNYLSDFKIRHKEVRQIKNLLMYISDVLDSEFGAVDLEKIHILYDKVKAVHEDFQRKLINTRAIYAKDELSAIEYLVKKTMQNAIFPETNHSVEEVIGEINVIIAKGLVEFIKKGIISEYHAKEQETEREKQEEEEETNRLKIEEIKHKNSLWKKEKQEERIAIVIQRQKDRLEKLARIKKEENHKNQLRQIESIHRRTLHQDLSVPTLLALIKEYKNIKTNDSKIVDIISNKVELLNEQITYYRLGQAKRNQ